MRPQSSAFCCLCLLSLGNAGFGLFATEVRDHSGVLMVCLHKDIIQKVNHKQKWKQRLSDHRRGVLGHLEIQP